MKNNKNDPSIISFFHNLLKHHLKCLSMEYDMSPEGKIDREVSVAKNKRESGKNLTFGWKVTLARGL